MGIQRPCGWETSWNRRLENMKNLSKDTNWESLRIIMTFGMFYFKLEYCLPFWYLLNGWIWTTIKDERNNKKLLTLKKIKENRNYLNAGKQIFLFSTSPRTISVLLFLKPLKLLNKYTPTRTDSNAPVRYYNDQQHIFPREKTSAKLWLISTLMYIYNKEELLILFTMYFFLDELKLNAKIRQYKSQNLELFSLA